MLTFFFDLADDKMIDDKNGVSLPSEKEARRYAVTFTRDRDPTVISRKVVGCTVGASLQRQV